MKSHVSTHLLRFLHLLLTMLLLGACTGAPPGPTGADAAALSDAWTSASDAGPSWEAAVAPAPDSGGRPRDAGVADASTWSADAAPAAPPPLEAGRKSAFGAIEGQSNAVGEATARGVAPLPWVPWREHVGLDAQSVGVVDSDWGPLAVRPGGHFGAEFGLAEAARASGYELALEKYAVVGTILANTGPIPSWLPTAGELYPAALAHLRAAIATCPCHRPLDFVVWWQGEADANAQFSADSYAVHMGELSAALRRDLASPSLLIIGVRLRASSPRTFAPAVRSGLEAWATTAPAINRWIDVDDVPTNAAGVHYTDKASVDEVGRRAWAEFLKASGGAP